MAGSASFKYLSNYIEAILIFIFCHLIAMYHTDSVIIVTLSSKKKLYNLVEFYFIEMEFNWLRFHFSWMLFDLGFGLPFCSDIMRIIENEIFIYLFNSQENPYKTIIQFLIPKKVLYTGCRSEQVIGRVSV